MQQKIKPGDKVKIDNVKLNKVAKEMGPVVGKHWLRIVKSEIQRGRGVLIVKTVNGVTADVYSGNPVSLVMGIPSVPVELLTRIEESKNEGVSHHLTFTTTTLKDVKSKKGFEIKSGEDVVLEWTPKDYRVTYIYKISGGNENKIAVLTQNLYKYVRGVSKPPSLSALERMVNSGRSKSVVGKTVEPDGVDPYGSPSWLMVMGYI